MTTTASTDAELLAQARRGDETAFAELYVRHESAARRLAKSYARAGDPDDLVNGAFERVLQALRKGMGPTDAFRAYVFVTLRRIAADRIARSRDAPHDEIPEPVRAEARDEGLDPTERSLIIDAYESLPDRWQTVLWHTAVEGRPPRDLAPTLGMSPNAAAALAYRAREKLRQAYLQAHLQTAPRPECEPHRSRLGAYVRDGLGARDRGATAHHLDECSSCRDLVAELADVNRLLVRSLLPIFVTAGEVAAALAAATTAVTGAAAAGAAAGAGTGGGLRGAADLGRRTWSRARSNPGATSAVVGALLVAAVIAGALIASHDDQVAQPALPPDEPAAPASPSASEPEPREVPLVVAPPQRGEPIATSEPTPTSTSGPPSAAEPAPSTTPSSSSPPATPTTWSPPPSSPPAPPGTDPAPTVPPPSTPPTTAPPTTTTTAPPPGEPCTVHLQLGGLLDLRICLDVDLSLLGVRAGVGG